MPPVLRAVPPVLRAPLALLLVFGLGWSAVLLAPAGSQVAAWWPAAGVAAALVALSPARRWPLLALGVAVAAGAANLLGGREPLTAALFGVGNAVEALVVATVLGAHRRRPRVSAVEDLPRFLLAAATGALTMGFLAACLVSVRGDAAFLPSWWTVLAAHGAALLAVLPLLLLDRAPDAWSVRHRGGAAVVQVVAQVLATCLVVAVVLGAGHRFPMTFVVLPLLLWGAFLLTPRLLAAEVLAIGVAITFATSSGVGPFAATSLSLQASESLTQLYLAVLTSITLPLSLALAQRRTALAEQQQARADLERERDFTAALLDATLSTAIIGFDPSGTITFFNRGAELMLGVPAAEVVGRDTPLRFHQQKEVEARAAALGIEPGFEVFVHCVNETGAADRRDWTVLRADGAPLIVSLTVNAMRAPDGTLIGYLSVAADVTERRRAEAAVRQALVREQAAVERLGELDRIKSEFVSSVSHELRTPMTAVLGFTQLLGSGMSGDLSDGQKKIVERLDRSGRRLLGLIENLLTLSRIEAGIEDGIGTARVEMRHVVSGAVEATEQLLRDRRVDFDVHVADVRSSEVVGNPEQLERVVVNLVSNAVKFTPDGGRVALSLAVEDDQVLLSVSDTGVGIPTAEQERLFERFFRASTATDAGIQGTGLGLAIVQSIIEAHGGDIAVTSDAGEGTTFVIALPLAA